MYHSGERLNRPPIALIPCDVGDTTLFWSSIPICSKQRSEGDNASSCCLDEPATGTRRCLGRLGGDGENFGKGGKLTFLSKASCIVSAVVDLGFGVAESSPL